MKQKLRIIPLGGLGEIGKNMTVLECGEDIIIVDVGLGFPEEEMFCVDLLLPDITYLRDKTARIWDAESGQELRVLTGHQASVYSAAFSSDG